MEIIHELKKNRNSYNEDEIKSVLKNLRVIKYGSITLVIQDSSIIQIETNEKLRIK